MRRKQRFAAVDHRWHVSGAQTRFHASARRCRASWDRTRNARLDAPEPVLRSNALRFGLRRGSGSVVSSFPPGRTRVSSPSRRCRRRRSAPPKASAWIRPTRNTCSSRIRARRRSTSTRITAPLWWSLATPAGFRSAVRICRRVHDRALGRRKLRCDERSQRQRFRVHRKRRRMVRSRDPCSIGQSDAHLLRRLYEQQVVPRSAELGHVRVYEDVAAWNFTPIPLFGCAPVRSTFPEAFRPSARTWPSATNDRHLDSRTSII